MVERSDRIGAQRESSRERAQRHSDIFEITTLGIVCRDASGELVAMNRSAERILGLSLQQFRQLDRQRPHGLRPIREDGSEFPASEFPLRVALETGSEVTDVVMGVSDLRNGGRTWLRINAVPQFEKGASRPCQAYATLEDITERKQAEAALRESEERYRAFIEDFQGIAYRVRIQSSQIEIFDGAVADITGYPREAFINKEACWLELIHPEDRSRTDREVEQAMAHPGRVSTKEYRIRRKDGQLRWVSDIYRVIQGENGQPTLVQGSIYDITERKQAEEERASLQAQIQHAQKLESLGLLAGGIAHDFNNLLCTMLGSAELAQCRLPPDHPARENLELVRESAERAAGLCRQMLAYAGKGRFVVEPVDLSRLVDGMTHLVQVSISKKITLRYDLPPDLPAVDADATQLRQIVLNLIVNAAEAIGAQSGTVAVCTGTADCDQAYLSSSYAGEALPAGRYVFLEVTDTGCGMDQETQAKLFDPFFSTKFTGRGLGLAAVLGIVRGHRGAIRVDSEPGRGSTFQVLLPGSESVASVPASPRLGGQWQGQGRVLVVDDEEGVRSVGRGILEHFGFEVLTAADGPEGLAVFRDHADSIDLVILDMTMPGLGGEEVFQQIRRIRPDVRVIVTSGYSRQEAASRFAGKGLASFMQKPFQMAVMRETIRAVMGE
jgi:two-component system cell cycle sensor histidine kinase/response regulator CckA